MTNASWQFPLHGSSHRSAATIAAGLLILVGSMFQLGELGYAHTSVDNLWYIPVLLNGICRMAEFCLNTPVLQDALRFWPLALVTAGVAILLSGKRAANSGAPGGEKNG